MKNTIFTGAATAIVTPFNSDWSVNYDQLATLIDYQLDKGIDAIVTCGTTGESATMSTEEHIDVMKFTVDRVAKRVPVIAGTGSNDTAYSLELSQEALKMGADALLLVTPYYNKASQKGLVKHFEYVADRIDLPVILYNVPSRTGCTIKTDTYVELAKHKNIVATKEASGDLSLVADIASKCDLDIYSGNDDQVIPIMSLGGKGVISVFSNILPDVMHNICDTYFKGNHEESAKLALQWLDLMNGLFMDVNPIPVKHACNLMGLDCGTFRLPLCEMEDNMVAKLKAIMANHGLIK